MHFFQFRERKSNNLRNLMRIGKRHLPGSAGGFTPVNDEAAPAGGMGAVYYFSPSFPNDNQFQAKIRFPVRHSFFKI